MVRMSEHGSEKVNKFRVFSHGANLVTCFRSDVNWIGETISIARIRWKCVAFGSSPSMKFLLGFTIKTFNWTFETIELAVGSIWVRLHYDPHSCNRMLLHCCTSWPMKERSSISTVDCEIAEHWITSLRHYTQSTAKYLPRMVQKTSFCKASSSSILVELSCTNVCK